MKDAKQTIAEAIKHLTAAYNSTDTKPIEKAVDLLRPLARGQYPIVPVRADMLNKVKSAPFYPTGEQWLDDWLSGGVRKEELILVAGVPYAGKTHFMTWFSSSMLKQGANVAHFFAEDIKTDVRDYYAAAVNRSLLSHLWLVDMVDYRFGVREVEGALEDLKKQKVHIDAAVIDNIDIMTPPWGAEATEAGQLKAIMRDLRVMTKRQNIVGITASQAHEKGGDRKGAARLFGSKIGKSGNADILIFVDRVYGNQYNLTLAKAKGRKIEEQKAVKTVIADWDSLRLEEA